MNYRKFLFILLVSSLLFSLDLNAYSQELIYENSDVFVIRQLQDHSVNNSILNQITNKIVGSIVKKGITKAIEIPAGLLPSVISTFITEMPTVGIETKIWVEFLPDKNNVYMIDEEFLPIIFVRVGDTTPSTGININASERTSALEKYQEVDNAVLINPQEMKKLYLDRRIDFGDLLVVIPKDPWGAPEDLSENTDLRIVTTAWDSTTNYTYLFIKGSTEEEYKNCEIISCSSDIESGACRVVVEIYSNYDTGYAIFGYNKGRRPTQDSIYEERKYLKKGRNKFTFYVPVEYRGEFYSIRVSDKTDNSFHRCDNHFGSGGGEIE